MKKFLQNTLWAATLFIWISCGNSKENHSLNFNDPYLQSFKNRNIKFQIGEGVSIAFKDTIRFDSYGIIVEIIRPLSREKRSYDSGGFLIEQSIEDDNSSQFFD